ncbi:MAG: glutamate synthase large subunit [Hyphomicrobiales bacterium]
MFKHYEKNVKKAIQNGVYNPSNEHDACGIGFVANIKNNASHQIVKDGLAILENLTHRGAVGADPKAGDGCGILTQIPDEFLRKISKELDFDLPKLGEYGVGNMFLPKNDKKRADYIEKIKNLISEENLEIISMRDIPVNNQGLGYSVKPTEPLHIQLFIKSGVALPDQDSFERKLFVLRKRIYSTFMGETDKPIEDFYMCSLSSRTLLYKGMLLADQLSEYFLDLNDKAFKSSLALVHQRFSTNTFPTWSLAQPFRMICHNGEINTLRGNVNWLKARLATLKSDLLGDDIKKIWPIVVDGASDSACFDNVLELLVNSGYSISHAMMTMIPEAWTGNNIMPPNRKAFYEHQASMMEPWDGPAAIAFTDGKQIGATLDRNGLRPARYFITDDDRVVLSSEMGVLPVKEENIIEKWRLQPGKMLLIDLEKGQIIADDVIKEEMANAHPYEEWLSNSQIILEDLPPANQGTQYVNKDLLSLQKTFGYTQEDLKFLLSPMAATGQEGIGSMGNDTPISSLSDKSKSLFTYFKQLFAQVTNPPIDPIREELVMSLVSFIGPRPNLLDPHKNSTLKRLEVRQPILTNEDLEKIRYVSELSENYFRARTLDITFANDPSGVDLEDVLLKLCEKAEAKVKDGNNIIILSDRYTSDNRVPIPSLLATSAVHHYLIKKGLRTSVGIVVETGEAREVHHFCTLAGYGAEAINPYLAFETIEQIRTSLDENISKEESQKRFIKAIDKGILKVMSKMGISTYQSYCGAQIFDAIGLDQSVIDKYFTGTHSKIGGVNIDDIAKESVARHESAYNSPDILKITLDIGGEYTQRNRGEDHAWNYNTISALQHAVRGNAQDEYNRYANEINEQDKRLLTIRGLMKIKKAEEDNRKSLTIDEVEPAKEIVKRFATGAMSFGSISREAHTNLAIAMNRIGGKSNTGEGGEEVDRFIPMSNGDSMRSAIKQVASGRFGVTAEYLTNSDMIQIKMAQGAKPGEGGQLPGHKVDAVIAKVRYSTPGVGLISPPPHHDIYSIEDLAQLIYDLKNANQEAQISVKLVSEVGVGTVAAGVAKAKSDHVTISGYEGGTGASPLTSIKHAGSPWEIGISETHQTLVLNKLRNRISVQVDGGLRTGRDVIIGALLGADEFGFSTAPLIASGCVMMRKCHLNTCPVGIATQDPELRKRFTGAPEHVVNYFFFVAEEVRKYMAEMGFKTFNEMIGQSQMLDKKDVISQWKAKGIDLSKILYKPETEVNEKLYNCEVQDHNLSSVLDVDLIKESKNALDKQEPVFIEKIITNVDRTTGAMLSNQIAKKYGHKGLSEDTIHIKFMGTSGQSFGAFVSHGVTMELVGEANDYVGKGLSGGKLIIYPNSKSKINPNNSMIVGNTVLYGAISGECYFRGIAGERFAVRNSGAIAVIEGTGDHGCEYMTGGCVVVLGKTGRNFAAGMSGGVAYVLDEDGEFNKRCNLSMVELEPIASEDDLLERLHHHGGDLETKGKVDVLKSMTKFDDERIYKLVSNHFNYTNSEKAKQILDNWEKYLPKFVKVMPVDYRRALLELEGKTLETVK